MKDSAKAWAFIGFIVAPLGATLAWGLGGGVAMFGFLIVHISLTVRKGA